MPGSLALSATDCDFVEEFAEHPLADVAVIGHPNRLMRHRLVSTARCPRFRDMDAPLL